MSSRFEVREGVYGETSAYPASVVDTHMMGVRPYPHQHQLVAACPSKAHADVVAHALNELHLPERDQA